MPISGVPEKESTLRILDMQVKASEIEDKSPLEVMRWQYWVTSGVILKAINEEYQQYAVSAAIGSVKLFLIYIEPQFKNKAKYFEEYYTQLDANFSNLSQADMSDEDKSKIIKFCMDILKFANSLIISKSGIIELSAICKM